MKRRRFLKLVSLAIGGASVRLAFPWAAAEAAVKSVAYAGLLYRAQGRGRISTSADGGATWRLHSDLGDIYSVSKLAVDRRNRLRATVAYSGRTFGLVLAPNMRSWLTT